MSMRLWKFAAFLTAMVVFLGVLASAPANAGRTETDRRRCVSEREFNSVTDHEFKKDLEKRWEVSGLGKTHVIYLGNVVFYPRCGAVRHFPDVAYGVGYNVRHDGRRYVVYLYPSTPRPDGIIS